ncbi:hypothetical protein MRB53_003334 [Persea americana]|uniref:Uncharacterized protein n=1 Tax=Persea americana TaxID=3435 RepID=A0ACC2MXA9_PERAE|nr:hypothetical protein MRB53_003334 [Persea americana]
MTNTSILFTDSFSVTLPAAYKVETCGVTTISLALLNYNISEPRNRKPTPNFLLSGFDVKIYLICSVGFH